MERVYYIDHVSNDDINALSLKLNSMQEVSHIKINKAGHLWSELFIFNVLQAEMP